MKNLQCYDVKFWFITKHLAFFWEICCIVMSLGNELQEKHTYNKESLWHILNMLYVTAW